jgi:hypothetical protein
MVADPAGTASISAFSSVSSLIRRSVKASADLLLNSLFGDSTIEVAPCVSVFMFSLSCPDTERTWEGAATGESTGCGVLDVVR